MQLSIVIPAYNEEKRLPNTLDAINNFLSSVDYSWQVIIVDNNSTDNTFKISSTYSVNNKGFLVVKEFQQGKGYAIRNGILESKGKYRFICDADLSMPIHEISKFLPPKNQSDICIGSREIQGAIRYNEPISRHLFGRFFNLMVQALLLPGIKDTQCGFKCFKDNVAEDIFNNLTFGGWSFDVEVLYIAKMRGYSLTEVPISWYYSP